MTGEGTARKGWLEEKRSAYLYRALSRAEPAPTSKALFANLADRAEAQAKVWEKHLGTELPCFHPGARARAVEILIDVLGARRIKPALAALKIRGLSALSYAELPPAHALPKDVSEVGERHQLKGSGGNLRAAVFGINDGLVSNASLILGVAAASSVDNRLILISGTAGLFAGALSMGAGEYVSVRSQRELLEYQLELERAELQEYPEEEAAELALIYEARGLSREQARMLANGILSQPTQALHTLAREELGIDPNDLGSPVGAALSSFLAFSAGGAIPLLPFVFGAATRPAGQLGLSLALTGTALFFTGATVSLFSGKSLLWSGLRMLLIGGGAGILSYLIGTAVG
ncbi:MAG: VIT1/CCC1 transporter family protein [Oligoflexia bacterium]|nr:VIT1/CCC1 transporter family protein [Oligoflexia bacterium]